MANQFSLYRISAPTADRSTAQKFEITVAGDQVMEEAEVRLLTQLKFETGEQVAAREGDDLVVIFADGSTLRLKKYYLLLESGQLRIDVEGLDVPSTTDSGSTDSSGSDDLGELGGLGGDDDDDDGDTQNNNNTFATPLAAVAAADPFAVQTDVADVQAVTQAGPTETIGEPFIGDFIPAPGNIADDFGDIVLGTATQARINLLNNEARPAAQTTVIPAGILIEDFLFNQVNGGPAAPGDPNILGREVDPFFPKEINANDRSIPAGSQVPVHVERVVKAEIADDGTTRQSTQDNVSTNAVNGTTANTNDPSGEFELNGDFGKVFVGRSSGNVKYEIDITSPDAPNVLRILTQLGKDQYVREVFSVLIKDDAGNVQGDVQLVFNIKGVNDSPTAFNQVPNVAVSITEDGGLNNVVVGRNLEFTDQARSLLFTDRTTPIATQIQNNNGNNSGVVDPELFPDAVKLGNNPLSTTAGSSNVIVFIHSHHLTVGDSILIAGATDTGGLLATELNSSHQISRIVSPDAVEIVLISQADSNPSLGTVKLGGGNNVTAQDFYQHLDISTGDVTNPAVFELYVFEKSTTEKSDPSGELLDPRANIAGNDPLRGRTLGSFTSLDPALVQNSLSAGVVHSSSSQIGIATIAAAGKIVTITTSAQHALQSGDMVKLSGFVDPADLGAGNDLDGVHSVTRIGANTFSFELPNNVTAASTTNAPVGQAFQEAVMLAGRFGNLLLFADGSFQYTRTAPNLGGTASAPTLFEDTAEENFTVILRDTANVRENSVSFSFRLSDDPDGGGPLTFLAQGQTRNGHLGDVVDSLAVPKFTLPEGGRLGLNITDIASLDIPGNAATPGLGANELVVEGTFGKLTVNKLTGDYKYELLQNDPDTQALAVGETGQDSFRYTIFDGAADTPAIRSLTDALSDTAILTVTVNGANDAPLSGAITTPVGLTEAGDASAQDIAAILGTLPVSDVDKNDVLTGSIKGTPVITWSVGALDGATNTALTAALVTDRLIFGSTVASPGASIGNPTGATALNWTYAPAAANFDFLAKDETLTVSFDLQATDPSGLVTTERNVTFTITGTNDAPTVSANTDGAVTEDVAVDGALKLNALGTITFDDVDLTNTHTIDPVTADGANALGGVLIASVNGGDPATGAGDGTVDWSYSVLNSATQFLSLDQEITEKFTVTIRDNDGGTVDREITITITGTNDEPVIDAIADKPLNEQTDTSPLTATIGVAFTDVDLTDVGHVATITNVTTSGTTTGLTLDTDALKLLVTPGTVTKLTGSSAGSVNLGFSAAASAFDYLADGETVDLNYTVQINDGDGGTPTQTFKITITGTNDAPTVSANTDGAVTEDVAVDGALKLNALGTITFDDVDLTNTHTIDPVTADGANALGGVLIASVNGGDPATGAGDGTVDWSYSVLNSATQFLSLDQEITEKFTVTIRDNDGGTVDREITITITGTNDEPVIDAIADKPLNEQTDTSPLTATIGVAFTDVDLTDVGHVATITNVTTSGTTTGLTLDTDALKLLVTPGTVTKLTGSSAGSVNLGFSAAASAFDYLADGETVDLNYTVQINDGDGGTPTQTFKITITGTNDAPVADLDAFAGGINDSVNFTEGGAAVSVAGANFSITDVDGTTITGATVKLTNQKGGDALTVGALPGGITAIVTTPGSTIVVTLSGSASLDDYEAAIRAVTFDNPRSNPSTVTRTVEIVVNDGLTNSSTATMSITVDTDNDAPTATASNATAVEQIPLDLAGKFTIDDPDSDNGTMTLTLTGGNAGQDRISVNVGATGALLTSGGNGTTNAAIVTGTLAQVQALLSTANAVTYTAASDTPVNSSVLLSINDGGNTGTGGAKSDSATSIITVTEVNDTPTATDDGLSSVAEDSGLPVISFASLLGNDFTGAGANEGVQTLTIISVNSAVGGTAVINGTNIDFTPDVNFEGTASFNYVIQDNGTTNGINDFKTDTGSVSFTVTPVNDPPVAVDDTGVATEAAGVANGTAGSDATGNVITAGPGADSDVDIGASLAISQVRTGGVEGAGTAGTVGLALTGAHGSLTLNADGSYTYAVDENDAAVEALNVGGTVQDTFNYTVSDGSLADTAVLVITINGANDSAVISGTIAGNVTEAGGTNNGTAGTPQDSGLLTAGDVDNPADTFTPVLVATASTGGLGTFTMTADGTWTYTLNDNNATVQALAVGDSTTDTFTVTSVDGTPQIVTVTITGANDAPVAVDDTGAATEAAGVANGTAGSDATGNVITAGPGADSDVDIGASLAISQVRTGGVEGAGTAGTVGLALTGAHGSLTLNADGSYTYAVDENDAAVEALNVGGTVQDTFNYTISDGSLTDTAVLTITINGANDAAIIGGADTGNVTEAGTSPGINIAFGVLTASDVDNPANTFTSVPGATPSTGGLGTFTMAPGGNWVYVLDDTNPTVQALAEGEIATDTFTVTSVDGTPQIVTVTITGANDAPNITNPSILGGLAGSTVAVTAAALGVTDVDSLDGNVNIVVNSVTNGEFLVGASAVSSFTLEQVQDGDVSFHHTGDSLNQPTASITATDDLAASSATTSISFAAFTPVALDLDGNGVQYQSLADSGHHLDVTGDGVADRIAWVSGNDGMLAYDGNHDGLINQRSEVAFTDHAPGARTDLEALHLAFDTNNDYKLDALDKEWSAFGVWHDVNHDGTFAANEFQSLESMGITSLSLVSDHVVSSPVAGVLDLGHTSFTFADGHTGIAADVAFAYTSGDAAGATSGHDSTGELPALAAADGSADAAAAATGTAQSGGELNAMSSETYASAQLHAPDAGSTSSAVAANSSSLPHIDEVLQNTATAELQLPPSSAAPHTDAAPAPAPAPPADAAVAAAPGDTGSDPQVASNDAGASAPAPANDAPPPPPPVDDHAGAPAAVV